MPRVFTDDELAVSSTRGSGYEHRRSQWNGAYALGLNVSHYMDHLVLHHSGASIGYQSAMLILPADGIAIVVLSNLRDGRGGVAPAIARDLLDELLGLNSVEWTKAALDELQRDEDDISRTDSEPEDRRPVALPLSAYVGKYRHPAYGRIAVSLLADEKLELSQGSQRRGLLRYLGHDSFALTWNGARPGPERVRFVIGACSRPVELLLEGQVFSAADPDRESCADGRAK